MKKPRTRAELDALHGKLVVIIKDYNAFRKGEKHTIKVSENATVMYPHFTVNDGRIIRYEHFELSPATKADFEREIKSVETKYRKELSELKTKIEYLEQSDAGEYNHNEFLAYNALKQIDSNISLTPIERARLLMRSFKKLDM